MKNPSHEIVFPNPLEGVYISIEYNLLAEEHINKITQSSLDYPCELYYYVDSFEQNRSADAPTDLFDEALPTQAFVLMHHLGFPIGMKRQ